jgi:hypothetical protein
MLTVAVPAATTALTSLDRLKFGLGIEDDANDEFLEMMIEEQSEYVCALLNVAAASDGTRTLGLETIDEILEIPILSRVPVVEVVSIMDGNGTVYDPADYRVDAMTGRFLGPPRSDWMNLVYNFMPPPIPVVVRYIAGWRLPNDADRNLPRPIESATLARVSTVRSSGQRDPNIKRENIPGVLETEYWVGSVGEGGIPADVWSQLSMYRRLPI